MGKPLKINLYKRIVEDKPEGKQYVIEGENGGYMRDFTKEERVGKYEEIVKNLKELKKEGILK